MFEFSTNLWMNYSLQYEVNFGFNERLSHIKHLTFDSESTTLPRTESMEFTEVTIKSIVIFHRAPNPRLTRCPFN